MRTKLLVLLVAAIRHLLCLSSALSPPEDKGSLWLYSNILKVLPQLMPDLISLWLKTRARTRQVPFLGFEPLLERSPLDIRQEYDLLPLFK